MSVRIYPPDDLSEALPLLRLLRSALSEDEIRRRARAAEPEGYEVLLAGAQDAPPIGLIAFGPIADVCWGRTLYVHDLVTHPDRRGEGVGAALLDAVAARARAQGFDALRLCSGLTRHDAHRFYEAQGMRAFSKQFVLDLTGG